jgi:EmrB/QacA subfamily drug resistance transporter
MAKQPTKTINQQSTQPKTWWQTWAPLIFLALALAIIIIDTTILNVSLKAIIGDLDTDLQKLQWVITAYSLTLAALTITGGRMGDLFGRKRMFMVGAGLFALGSLIAALSVNVGMLLFGEAIVEGIGAALMMPATASLLLSTYEGRASGVAFGVWGGIAGAAATIGPLVGGYLTTAFTWRWGFLINIFVAAALLIGSYIYVKESRDVEHKPTLDWVGVALSSLGLLAVVFGVIESSSYGWWSMKKDFVIGNTIIWGGHTSFVPFVIILGLILLAIFIWWERRMEKSGKLPLVTLRIFKNRQFSAGVFTTAILSLGQLGLFLVLPIFWQAVKGLDALHTGLVGLPMSLTMLVVAPASAMLLKWFTPKRIIQVGLLINMIAILVMRESFAIDATWQSMTPAMVLFGIGMGLTMAQISNLTLSAVPMDLAGEGSGVNGTMRQVGSSLGAAIIGAALLSAVTANFGSNIESSTVLPPQLKPVLTTVTDSPEAASVIEFGGAAGLNQILSKIIPGQIPPVVDAELLSISQRSLVDAAKEAMLYTFVFGLLGFISAFFLVNKRAEGHGAAATAAEVTK